MRIMRRTTSFDALFARFPHRRNAKTLTYRDGTGEHLGFSLFESARDDFRLFPR
jgi:hypothetical protein